MNVVVKPGQPCGLLASDPVKWLIGHEPLLRAEAEKFIRGQCDRDYVDIALPPSWLEVQKYRAGINKIELPLVRIFFKLVDHLGTPHLMATCSDEETDIIASAIVAKRERHKEEIYGAAHFEATGKFPTVRKLQ